MKNQYCVGLTLVICMIASMCVDETYCAAVSSAKQGNNKPEKQQGNTQDVTSIDNDVITKEDLFQLQNFIQLKGKKYFIDKK